MLDVTEVVDKRLLTGSEVEAREAATSSVPSSSALSSPDKVLRAAILSARPPSCLPLVSADITLQKTKLVYYPNLPFCRFL